MIKLTNAANIITPEITATTMPAITPASRPLFEIPGSVLGVSGTPVIIKIVIVKKYTSGYLLIFPVFHLINHSSSLLIFSSRYFKYLDMKKHF